MLTRTLSFQEQELLQRTKEFGPIPNNKFRQLRLAADLTIDELRQQSFIDHSVILRAEQGLYTNPPPSLVDYWVARRKVTYQELLAAYESYQTIQRQRHRKYFGDTLVVDITKRHPFKQLRGCRPNLLNNEPTETTLVEVSKALCLPLDTLQFFEKKFRTQQSVPKGLKRVLLEIGYSQDQVDNFEVAYKEWRKLQLLTKTKVTFS